MKFGAILIAGCGPSHRHPAGAAADGEKPKGPLLYRPMTVYANSSMLSKKRITAKPIKTGMDRVTPDRLLDVRSG